MIISFHYIPNFPTYVFFHKHKHKHVVFNTKDTRTIDSITVHQIVCPKIYQARDTSEPIIPAMRTVGSPNTADTTICTAIPATSQHFLTFPLPLLCA